MAEDKVTLGIISHQPIARSMAGPGIRCWEVARALAGDADVKLFTPAGSELEPEGFELVTYSEDNIVQKAAGCDAILCQGFILNNKPELTRLGKYLIVDLYVPMSLEALAQYEQDDPGRQNAIQEHILSALIEQLSVGNFFICASERQRDYWLGLLSAVGRIEAQGFSEDPSLYNLIDTVPFGLPGDAPVATKKVLKGVYPGIRESDKVLLWGGGIYNWLDPFTPIRAMSLLSKKRDDIKLFFLGVRHPDPSVPKMRVYDEAVGLSRELGLYGDSVIFNEKWVDYDDRVNFLLEADVGVNANISHIETRFSFRTRMLDYIWGSLPVVTTRGDSLSDLVEKGGLGLAAASNDAQGFADAIERLVDDEGLRDSCRENLAQAAEEFRWERSVSCIRNCLERIDPRLDHRAAIHKLAVRRLYDDGEGNSDQAGDIFASMRHNLRRLRRNWRKLPGEARRRLMVLRDKI